MFRKLNDEEKQKFRRWARENYKPGDQISPSWHPVNQTECAEKVEEAHTTSYCADCPRCGEKKLHAVDWHNNALSRRDNDTMVCSDCGTDEAIQDFQRGLCAENQISLKQELLAWHAPPETIMKIIRALPDDYPTTKVILNDCTRVYTKQQMVRYLEQFPNNLQKEVLPGYLYRYLRQELKDSEEDAKDHVLRVLVDGAAADKMNVFIELTETLESFEKEVD